MLTRISKLFVKEPKYRGPELFQQRVPAPVRTFNRLPEEDILWEPVPWDEDQPMMTPPILVRRLQPFELKKGGVYRAVSNIPVRALGVTPGGNMVLVQYDRRLFNQGEYVEIGCYSVPMTQTRDHLGFSIIHEPPVDYYENEDF